MRGKIMWLFFCFSFEVVPPREYFNFYLSVLKILFHFLQFPVSWFQSQWQQFGSCVGAVWEWHRSASGGPGCTELTQAKVSVVDMNLNNLRIFPIQNLLKILFWVSNKTLTYCWLLQFLDHLQPHQSQLEQNHCLSGSSRRHSWTWWRGLYWLAKNTHMPCIFSQFVDKMTLLQRA